MEGFLIGACIYGIFFAAVCGMLANERGRSPGGWAAAGFFFGIFGLIALVCMGKKVEKRISMWEDDK